MYSPEVQAKIALWRRRADAGELTQEEMREAVSLIRQGRVTAGEAVKAKRTSARKAVRSADELLASLGALMKPDEGKPK